MKRAILSAAVTALYLCVFAGPACPQGAWVNYEGCYCGGYEKPPIEFACRGSGTELERSATAAQLDYWNEYAYIFTPCLDSGPGSPNNGRNEINTFITNAEAARVYGYNFSGFLGYTIIIPGANFGNFNECKDITPHFSECGPYTETDIILLSDVDSNGWTTDPAVTYKHSVQATALHEFGHAWGAHHVFNTSPYEANALSVMNYAYDPAMMRVARMDANTIRARYPGQKRYVTDVGIFPFMPGNGQRSETYAQFDPDYVSVGQTCGVGRVTVQNLGTSDVSKVKIEFYLSKDNDIDWNDYNVGHAVIETLNVDEERIIGPTPFTMPAIVANGDYYVGAIVSLNWNEDPVKQNNRCILYDVNGPPPAPANMPVAPERVLVYGSSAAQPTPNPWPTPGPPAPDQCCVVWYAENYVELSINPSSINSGGALSLKYNGSYSDVNFGSDPVNVYLAIVKDPVASGEPSTVDEVLNGGSVWLFEDGMNSNYRYQGRVYEPTWKKIRFGPNAPSGELNFRLTAPLGEYVFATAFVNARTGEFIRTDEPVENTDTFRVE